MIEPNFRHEINGKKLATAIVQDYESKEILMLAFIDKEAYQKSIETKKAHFYSTSRNKIWFKGEESGHTQIIQEVLFDCDKDAIIFKVKQNGGACHTGHYSCFYCRLSDDNTTLIETQQPVFNPEDIYNK